MNEAEFKRIFSLPFAEAERFFRDKLNLESDAWDDLWQEAHAKAFTSAGAYQAELLAELRAITDKAIAGGLPISEFRKEFIPLVEKYGWQLKGGNAAWRSDLIWRTNISTAYQAGRWQQFRDGGIDYLMYVHNDSVRHPRPNHVALDGKIFAIDEPFWTYNYPPNGWGCKCLAVAASEGEYRNAPEESRALPANYDEMADFGWRYNVGAAGEEHGYRALTAKLESLTNDIARAWMERFVLEPAYARFLEGKIRGDFPVAVLKPADMEALGSKRQTVWLSDDALAGIKGSTDLTVDDYRMIPKIINQGEVFPQGDDRLVVLEFDGMIYQIVLQPSENGDGSYFLSLFTVEGR